MINALLHKQVVALDRNDHRTLRYRRPVTDWSVASRLNSIFVAAVEFGDVARDLPVVFVNAGDDEQGRPDIAPVAVLGLKPEQNLYIDAANGWRANYMPALLRTYPFAIGRIDDERFAVCIDAASTAISASEGEPLFTPEGEPAPVLVEMQTLLESLETETQRTRAMCQRLRDLELLRDMRYDATLPDGSTIGVDGFLTVDDAKLNGLSDAIVVELHRSGLLGLIHAHFVSLGNMGKLLNWHAAALQTGQPDQPHGDGDGDGGATPG